MIAKGGGVGGMQNRNNNVQTSNEWGNHDPCETRTSTRNSESVGVTTTMEKTWSAKKTTSTTFWPVQTNKLIMLMLWLHMILYAGMFTTDATPIDDVAIAATSTNTRHIANETTEQQNPRSIWRLIKRSEWLARSPTTETNFTGPATFVIIHHSYNPGVCLTMDACKASMRSMQNFHMDGHGWPDIGYTYAVGGDGNVYEGRGYNVVGAHAPNYNSRSIGLLLIGNFVENLPPPPMLQVAQDFIEYSIEMGNLTKDYILYGHRQVRSTDCPGDALYAEIKLWQQWHEV